MQLNQEQGLYVFRKAPSHSWAEEILLANAVAMSQEQ
jgi:hypothetical protein